jgi:hypothetical protein
VEAPAVVELPDVLEPDDPDVFDEPLVEPVDESEDELVVCESEPDEVAVDVSEPVLVELSEAERCRLSLR